MNVRLIVLLSALCLLFSGMSHAHKGKEKHDSLPPGLQKKVDRGESLPPGWQKKLKVGNTLDQVVYESGNVIDIDIKAGIETIRVEDKLIKLIKNTREIIEIIKPF